MIDKSFIRAAEYIPNLLQRPSAWIGHLPFAFWLTGELKPKCLVELGTHYGHSYFSFCEGVTGSTEEMNFFAVDTWQGDAHAGTYDSVVFDEVKKNNLNYAKFSTLLKMTFDEAANNIDNESIDILHIDGLHTYEAVRHDFEKWFPKLKAGAVVLFHDTAVKEKDFGVWRFWAEICNMYPNNLEFLHSCGLGVVQINNCKEDNLIKWLRPNSVERENVKKYFGAIGMHQINRFRSFDLERQIHQLNDNILEINKRNDLELNAIDEIIKKQEILIDQKEFIINSLNCEVSNLNYKIDKIFNSRSWRYTSALRSVFNVFRGNK
jgi:hypothetical protein